MVRILVRLALYIRTRTSITIANPAAINPKNSRSTRKALTSRRYGFWGEPLAPAPQISSANTLSQFVTPLSIGARALDRGQGLRLEEPAELGCSVGARQLSNGFPSPEIRLNHAALRSGVRTCSGRSADL